MRQEAVILGAMLAAALGGAGYAGYGLIKAEPHHKSGSACHSCRPSSAHPSPWHLSPAASTVMKFYDLIGKSNWDAAMTLQSPEFRGRSTVESFEAGYATTKEISVNVVDQDTNVVPVDMKAVDVYSDGVRRVRKFHIVWTLGSEDGVLLLKHASVKVISDSAPEEDANLQRTADQGASSESNSNSPPAQSVASAAPTTEGNHSVDAMIYESEARIADAEAWALRYVDASSADNESLPHCLTEHELRARDASDDGCEELGDDFSERANETIGNTQLAFGTLAQLLLDRVPPTQAELDEPEAVMDARVAEHRAKDLAQFQVLLREATALNAEPIVKYAKVYVAIYRDHGSH